MACIFFLIEMNKNRFVFIPLYGLKWILKNSEILIGNGFKRSKNLNLNESISVHLNPFSFAELEGETYYH